MNIAQIRRIGPKAEKFPFKFPHSGNFTTETGPIGTVSSATQSVSAKRFSDAWI
jgi:hypothetical protein